LPGVPTEPTHVLLVNPSAGGGRTQKLLAQAQAALADGGIEYRLVLTQNIAHGREEARKAAELGQTVIVMSGDGLIGQVGGELANTSSALGIIPGGRGNDFARVVGIPVDVEEAAGIVAGGATRQMDVADANGVRYLCIASCGFDSEANRIANEAKRVKGQAVYAYAALRALAAWKPATFTLTIDGERTEVTGYSVAAANTKAYGGGMIAVPSAVPDDGFLEVSASGNVSKLRFLRGLGQVFKGEHLETMQVQTWRASEVTIEADRPFSVYADGDPVAELPATFRILPGALRVIVPPDSVQ
jgi:YegS/Rv2252/BmrU family lipid kinase